MRFVTWSVRSLYRSGSILTTARELTRYKLDLGSVQTVKWKKEGSVRAGDLIFYMEKE
jgi:hypothetical protein